MRLISLCSILILSQMSLSSQNVFVGKYTGQANGDNIELTLQNNGDNTFNGNMKDSQQSYIVNAATNGNRLTGTAIETTIGLTFVLDGTLSGNQLPIKMTIEVGGQSNTILVNFVKQGSQTPTATKTAAAENSEKSTVSKPKLPSGATHNPNLVGKWVKQEHYSSGYGSDAMHGSFNQSMILFADGSVSDGGTRAGISGSNYSASSADNGEAVPNVFWYNIDNQLYFQGTQNGQTQSVHLGQYYIENGKMLITATNGTKSFLTKM
jgi:prepilin-type processing-associated H-X9-DG protein